jgi:alkanesulfonate monooxygenase SsuD/methylene tetrahydromethanopterin reductase-like flavin-dependent oxidoreductase (luciferase family)
MSAFPAHPRATVNPIFNSNRLKLGVFGINGPGTVMTTHPARFTATWQASLTVAQMADRAGFEAIVPYSRWKPFGPAGHPTGVTLDTFAWAAGVGALTRNSGVFSTCHTPTLHPLIVAKQGATIDHITGGRFALNVVVGWFIPEMETFGVDAAAHADRYDQADEWITILKRLWTETDEVDFDGRFLQVRGGVSTPKPVQKPLPPIMNAGGSERGRQFAAKHADVAFVVLPDDDPATIRSQVESYKRLAKSDFGREIQVWAYALVIQGNTLAEARSKFDDYTFHFPDDPSIDVFLNYQVKNLGDMPPEAVKKLRLAIAGGGGVQLFGPPADIVARLELLSGCGIDGILLTFVDYEVGMARFTEEVLPLLEATGLRQRQV